MTVKDDLAKIQRRFELMGTDIPKREFQAIANAMVSEMKDLVSKGISPIQGRGRFEGYRGKYPKSVQAKFPSKRDRPVNLYLSGKFLASLHATAQSIRDGASIVIGFGDALSKRKEQGHRDGANGQAERPIIPAESENFAQTVQRIAVDGLTQALQASVKRNKGN